MPTTNSDISASDAPTSRVEALRPLRVAIETSPGSGTYVLEPRASVDKLTLGSDSRVSEAEVSIAMGPIWSSGAEELTAAQLISGRTAASGGFISPDQRVIVFVDAAGDDPARRIIFSGFVDLPRYAESPREISGSMVVSGVLKRLSKTVRGQVWGRYVRTAAELDAYRAAVAADSGARLLAIGDGDSVQQIARPCVFNARGEANRAPAPIAVTIDGEERNIHVFTHDDDPDAEPWTWTQVLRYLTYFHGLELDESGDLAGLVGLTNVFDQTDNYAGISPEFRLSSPVYEDPDYVGHPFDIESQVLRYCLMSYPADAVFEGESILDALSIVAHATQSHFRIQTIDEETVGEEGEITLTGKPRECLIWWARGGGPRRVVAKDVSAQYAETIPEVLDGLNINEWQVGADYGDIINAVIGHGDIRRYEITADLVPGWEPDANVDVPADVDAAVEASEAHWGSDDPDSDTWYTKYHVNGSSFPDYADVGRRWVLNETGRYQAADYGRASGNFGAAAYTPWEPDDCSITDRIIDDDGNVATPAVASGAWARIPRPFKPCLSADLARRSLGVVVEASFDGGTTWQRIACTVLNTEAGIYIGIDDLTELVSVHDPELHWWKAMCNDNARIRVTAVIEGDEHLEPNVDGAGYVPPISHEAARLFDWSDRFKSNRRGGGNSIFAVGGSREAPAETLEAVDDLESIQDYAKSILDLCTSRALPCSFTIPWLEFTRYWVGDCIRRIDGQGLLLEGAAAGGARRPPDIVAMVYSGTTTQIVLEDANLAEAIGA